MTLIMKYTVHVHVHFCHGKYLVTHQSVVLLSELTFFLVQNLPSETVRGKTINIMYYNNETENNFLRKETAEKAVFFSNSTVHNLLIIIYTVCSGLLQVFILVFSPAKSTDALNP